MILLCKCQNENQDKIHGVQKRVHNRMKDPSKFRCTVCCDIKTIQNKSAN